MDITKSNIYFVCNPNDDVVENTPDEVGSITGDVVVIGDDNEVTYYNDCQFVDEDNSRFYCPTTNNWTTYNSYSYDYSTMTYNFTDVDNNTYSISYGDEYITYSETVNNVTNEYNYYYYVDSGSGEEEEPTEVLGWLEVIYNKLVEIGETLFSIEGTVEDIDDQMPEGQDSKSTIKTFFNTKFGWLDSVGDIGESFITDITADQGMTLAGVTAQRPFPEVQARLR